MLCRTRLPDASMSRLSSPWLVATLLTSRRPDGSVLVSDVSFSIGNERVGLIGPNAAGKSTLLRLASGELAPDRGTVERSGRLGHLTQRSALPGTATVADLLGVSDVLAALARCDTGHGTAEDVQCIGDRWDLNARVQDALERYSLSHLTLDRSLRAVSGGERTRLRLAAVLLDAPDLLVLDEPTNHLDTTHRDAVLDLIRTWPRGLLVATHDRALLEHVDRIIAIERGTVRSYGGNWQHYLMEREAQRLAAEREHSSALASRERVRREQQEARERQARRAGSGRRARADGGVPRIMLGMMKERSEATGARLSSTVMRAHEAADLRVRTARERMEERTELILPHTTTGLASGTLVAALRQATIHVHTTAPLLTGVDLEIRGPERIALVGANGSGKSTLLRVLAGQHPVGDEMLYRGIPMRSVVFLDQHATLLDAHHTILEAARAVSAQRGESADEETLRAALARFGFRAEQAERRVTTLSGGERMRAALGCVLGVTGEKAPRLLLLDEPNNHLDLDSLQAVEQALRYYDGALVVASHDRHFLEAIGVTRTEPLAQWRAFTTDP